jgi:20S proteasome alpha/beta subunit
MPEGRESALERGAETLAGTVHTAGDRSVVEKESFAGRVGSRLFSQAGEGNRHMTVCIGALCDDGKAIVVASDRMMTYSAPMNLQVEMPVKKIVAIGQSVAILFSGGVADGEDVISKARAKICGSNKTIHEIADATAASYQEIKRRKVEDTILRPLIGIDFNSWASLLAQSAASQSLAQILGMISQHNLQLELLVAGFDDSGGHLFGVFHPGISMPMDTIGCGAIGSGGLHANVRLSLGGQIRGLSMADTLFNVYEAKAAAEVAPGVGKLTDIAIVSPKEVRFFDDDVCQSLSSMLQKRPELRPEDRKKLQQICKVPRHEAEKPG